MAANKQLSRFVRDALTAGKSREDIADVLATAGWSKAEVSEALGAWAATPFSPPIPRPQVTVSARDFFIYTLTFGVLIIGAAYLVGLLHNLLDVAFDNKNYASHHRIRWAIAVLVVTVPVFIWLTLREQRKLREDSALYRSAIRKWLTYLTLLIAAAVLLGDLVATVHAFLDGDFTMLFVTKALVVAAVAGGIFLYYISDLRKGDGV